MLSIIIVTELWLIYIFNKLNLILNLAVSYILSYMFFLNFFRLPIGSSISYKMKANNEILRSYLILSNQNKTKLIISYGHKKLVYRYHINTV